MRAFLADGDALLKKLLGCSRKTMHGPISHRLGKVPYHVHKRGLGLAGMHLRVVRPFLAILRRFPLANLIGYLLIHDVCREIIALAMLDELASQISVGIRFDQNVCIGINNPPSAYGGDVGVSDSSAHCRVVGTWPRNGLGGLPCEPRRHRRASYRRDSGIRRRLVRPAGYA